MFEETPFDSPIGNNFNDSIISGGETSPPSPIPEKPKADEFELVTPDKAREWLAKNAKNNRAINEHTVKKYARMMANGDWDARGHDPICFCEDGFLQNGQHRLVAVIHSETSVWFPIARNLAKNSIEKLDQGKARSVTNVAQIRGIDSFKQQYYTILLRMIELSAIPSVSKKADKHLLLDFVEEYWDLIVSVYQNGTPSEVSAVCANAILLEYDEERVRLFLNILDGEPSDITENDYGALALKFHLVKPNAKKRRVEIANYAQSALRSFLNYKPVKNLVPVKKLVFVVPELQQKFLERTIGDPI